MDLHSLDKFFFVRHGETDWNLENRFQGQNDIPLNDTGRKQATEAVDILTTLGIDMIFCSQLSRARETSSIFAQKLPVSPEIIVVSEFAECESEVTARMIYSGLGRKNFPSFSEVSKNVETPEGFVARVEQGLRLIFNNIKGRTPIIVAHGGTYWAICQLFGVLPNDIPNCRPIKFEKHHGSWSQETIWT